MPIDINGSTGACQRFATHLQLQLSTVTVLLAAAWALLLHAGHSVLACIASGFSSQKAAAKSHLMFLKSASPSRWYRTAAAKAIAAAPVRSAQPCSDAAPPGSRQPSAGALQRRHAKQKRLQDVHQHTQSHSTGCASMPSVSCNAVAGPAAVAGGGAMRLPMQLQEHRNCLTVVLDLDETLLCTYRLERCAGQGDALQLVPSNRPGPASTHASIGNASSSSVFWPALLGRDTSTGTGSSSSSMGSYTISKHCTGLPGDLGAAARATAWMHYVPPSTALRGSSSAGGGTAAPSSSSSTPTGLLQAMGGQPALQLPGPHTLAVFERPGCREFLAQLSSFCELVLFTAASPQYGAPLADMLDPEGRFFRGRLYGDACVSRAGRRGVKDLECLGRDARRVVLVDNCLFSFLAQPRNGLPCMPFHGALDDSQLLSVILPLLWSLSQVGGDIRPLLDSMFRVRHWLASKGYTTPEEDGP